MQPDIDVVPPNGLKALRDLEGQLVWQVRRSADRVLRMDFGSPYLKIREPISAKTGSSQVVIEAVEKRIVVPTGEWHLFVSNADWSVTTRFYTCCRSDIDSEHIDLALRQLDGQRLVNVRRVPDTVALLMEFDLGGSLGIGMQCYPGLPPPENEIIWTLFRRDGSYTSCDISGDVLPRNKL